MREPPASLDEALAKLGYASFRPGQREAIEELVAGGRLLLVAPTGGGKSLVYQLPATVLSGTTIVVSPLIALMQDQVQALSERGVAATYLASTLDGDEIRVRLARLAAGEYSLVYVAPERLGVGVFAEIVNQLDVPLIAIDEAHCISEWGHDFRPEYLAIGDLLQQIPEARVLACTATATPVVRDEILARLGLKADTPQHVRGFSRPNLRLGAREVFSGAERSQAVDALLQEALGSPESVAGAAIVYAPTRKTTEAEAKRLGELGYRAAAYHAGLSGSIRDRVQRHFTVGRVDVVVATNAFGMGIDRADVRAVVHLAPPGSIEAYYQEVGRGGRDGEPAWGLLLTSAQDMALRRRLLEMPVDDRVPAREVVEHKWGLFLELMRWAEGGSCRHDAILRYFDAQDEALGGCGQCDVCRALVDRPDMDEEATALVVRKALSGVARIRGRFGLQQAVKLLRGQADERLARLGLTDVRTFGVLKEQDPRWLQSLLRRCVTAGWVQFSGEERPVVRLTSTGIAVMRGERPAQLLLPPQRGRKSVARPGRGRGRPATAPVTDDLDEVALSLFERLRAYRLETARESGVPPYVVASDRTLRDLALLRPGSLQDLLMCHGIGPTKAERYGQGFLDVIAAN